MKKLFLGLILALFMVGCATTATTSKANFEERQFSSAFYAVKVKSSDGWESAVMEDSDGNTYDLKRTRSASGVLLASEEKNVNIHIKGQNALLQNSMGEYFVLEEVK